MRAIYAVCVTLVLAWLAVLAGAALQLPSWIVLGGWVLLLASGARTAGIAVTIGCALAGLALAAAGKALVSAGWGSPMDLYLLTGGVLVVVASFIAQYLPFRSSLVSYGAGLLISFGSGGTVEPGAVLLTASGMIIGILVGFVHVKALDRTLQRSGTGAA